MKRAAGVLRSADAAPHVLSHGSARRSPDQQVRGFASNAGAAMTDEPGQRRSSRSTKLSPEMRVIIAVLAIFAALHIVGAVMAMEHSVWSTAEALSQMR
jgi:hypothetical protein